MACCEVVCEALYAALVCNPHQMSPWHVEKKLYNHFQGHTYRQLYTGRSSERVTVVNWVLSTSKGRTS